MKNYAIRESLKLKNGKYQQFFKEVKLLLFYIDQRKFVKKHTFDYYTIFHLFRPHLVSYITLVKT